jgi:hypothetical protein
MKSNWFTIFFISDAIVLIFSLTSKLAFLSILTSSYREDDFLKAIPLRLLGGLAALFISITFSATCFLVYYSKAAWAPMVITALAIISIILFVQAHFQLWIEEINVLTIRTNVSLTDTYWARFLFWSHVCT